MKNTTRRDLLSKLGIGAVAVTAIAVAGAPNSAMAAPEPLDPYRTVVIPLESNALQIVVGFSTEGFTVKASPSDQPAIGLSKDLTELSLGVFFDDKNVALTGLDVLANRTASAGRCWMDDVDVSASKF